MTRKNNPDIMVNGATSKSTPIAIQPMDFRNLFKYSIVLHHKR